MLPQINPKHFLSVELYPFNCAHRRVCFVAIQNIIQLHRGAECRNAPFKTYLSFSLCEGCGSSLPPCRALVYFQWYSFQASNHIIKALHHIYSSSKVSDNLQLFSTPTAKPCTNMNTLGSILIMWCILSLAWFIFMRVKTLAHTVYWQS